MTNIEAIKEDYKEGDGIRIVCSLGIKEGFILEITENRIKIQPFEEGRKPVSIPEENIKEFEEAIPPASTHGAYNVDIKPSVSEVDSSHNKDISEFISSNALSSNSKEHFVEVQSSLNQADKEKQDKVLPTISQIANNQISEIEVGHPEFNIKNVGKIDLSKIPSSKKEQERRKQALGINTTAKNKSKSVIQSKPANLPPHTSIRKICEKIINSYKSEEDNQEFLSASGVITKTYTDFGWIWDQNLKKDIWFHFDNICDDDINPSKGLQVIYRKINNNNGEAKAIGICLPSNIYELLGIADFYIDDKSTAQKSADILSLILAAYPNNEDANEMFGRIKSHTKKYQTHSINEKYIAENHSIEISNKQHETSALVGNLEKIKPSILLQPETLSSLPLDKPMLSDVQCKEFEKELDILIRNGEREKCLAKSYEILAKYCPTPKYLRSYLDRMVNTEIALNNYDKAANCLAQLICYSEKTQDVKINTLSHLYLSLARILHRLGESAEAEKAIICAEKLRPNEPVLANYKAQIIQNTPSVIDNKDVIEYKDITELPTSQIIVSKMLQQDVEQRINDIDPEKIQEPKSFYDRANASMKDNNKTFETRAQLFLDAAASYLYMRKDSLPPYKYSVAHYARMKGNSMYNRVSQYIIKYPESQDELIAFCDSARSYFLEALGIYNDLGQKRYLQELLLKYLKLERVISQIDGGKTPDPEWYSGTLKAKLKECLEDGNVEGQKVLYKTCIAIGSAAERAWNTLSYDKDGTGPMFAKFINPKFKESAYLLFNEIEQSNVSLDESPGNFVRKIFRHRLERIESLNKLLEICLNWHFDHFQIKDFSNYWSSIQNYVDLFTQTDKKAADNITRVINALQFYNERNENERYLLLMNAQQALLDSLKLIRNTTTFYGRTFFFHISENWQSEINKQINKRLASTYPKLTVVPDPCFIKEESDGRYIHYIVQNNGDSTTDSFVLTIACQNTKESFTIKDTLISKSNLSLKWKLPESLIKESVLNVKFSITPTYLGKQLDATDVFMTFEDDTTDEIDIDKIPWNVSKIPSQHIFKGRTGDLNKLKSHYLSTERTRTFILYGLTRTGKSTILKFLRDSINNKPLSDKKDVLIRAFDWDFSKVNFEKDKEDEFWEHLIGTKIYDTLSKEEQEIVNKSYRGGNFPDRLGQNDFLKIIDVLNSIKLLPFITIDEFSNVKNGMDNSMLNASFLSILRDLSIEGKACFLYAGTYDIKDLPREEKYGITGQLVNTDSMRINAIEEEPANQLINAWVPTLNFTPDAMKHIRKLSGCVPYWIQWICLNCAKFAATNNRHWLGLDEVEDVVKIMTGERMPSKTERWSVIDEANFQNNQYTPNATAEHALITTIAYLNNEKKEETSNLRISKPHGVSIQEITNVCEKFNISSDFQEKMLASIEILEEKKILQGFTDENRQVYILSVDLFRRWWFVHHKDLYIYSKK